MQVTATHDAPQLLRQATGRSYQSDADFQSILESTQRKQEPAGATVSKAEPVAAMKKTPAEELAEYLRKTPAQHMRDAILKKMGLTEADLAAMTPEKRAAVEEAITDQIKEMLQEQNGNTRNQEKLSAALQRMSVGENGFAVSGPLLPATADIFGG